MPGGGLSRRARASEAVPWAARTITWSLPIPPPPPTTLPAVTVVIPTFNRRGVLGRAIDSVLRNAGPPLDVVVVDDGSTDGTARWVRATYADDDRVRVLEKPNGGCGSARNVGARHAHHAYVAYLDSDDRAEPGRFARQAAALEAHPQADLCIGDAHLEDARGRPAGRMYAHKGFVAPLSLEAMFHGAWAAPSTWMVRTEVARALPFDETIPFQEDVAYLFSLFREGRRVHVLDEVVCTYRVAGDDTGATRLSDQQSGMDAAWAKVHRENWERLGDADRAHIRRPAHVHRRLAKHYLRTRDYARARPHCQAWWRSRPHRLRPLLRWLECVARARGSTP